MAVRFCRRFREIVVAIFKVLVKKKKSPRREKKGGNSESRAIEAEKSNISKYVTAQVTKQKLKTVILKYIS